MDNIRGLITHLPEGGVSWGHLRRLLTLQGSALVSMAPSTLFRTCNSSEDNTQSQWAHPLWPLRERQNLFRKLPHQEQNTTKTKWINKNHKKTYERTKFARGIWVRENVITWVGIQPAYKGLTQRDRKASICEAFQASFWDWRWSGPAFSVSLDFCRLWEHISGPLLKHSFHTDGKHQHSQLLGTG